MPYISRDGYLLFSGMRPDTSPWEAPGWPPSATPVLPPPKVPGLPPVDPTTFTAQPAVPPFSDPSAPIAPLQLMAPVSPLQFSILTALGQSSTARLVEKLRQPSDYWRAIHDTVYISHGSEPLAKLIGDAQFPVPTSHCTGYLLTDRTTVVTAAHCLGLWGNSLGNEQSAGGEDSVDLTRECIGQGITFTLAPALMQDPSTGVPMLTDDERSAFTGHCDNVQIIHPDLARFTLRQAMRDYQPWVAIMTPPINIGILDIEDVAMERPVFLSMYPQSAGLYEDFGELRAVKDCSIAFAYSVTQRLERYGGSASDAIGEAVKSYGCTNLDTYQGGSGGPVFLRKPNVQEGVFSAEYSLVGIVISASSSVASDELAALSGEWVIPQGCGLAGRCNLFRRLVTD